MPIITINNEQFVQELDGEPDFVNIATHIMELTEEAMGKVLNLINSQPQSVTVTSSYFDGKQHKYKLLGVFDHKLYLELLA